MRIKDIDGIEILDSRGNPTVKAIVTLEDGTNAAASVPSGASTGSFEAYELRDGNDERYFGKGVVKAISNITDIIKPALISKGDLDQEELDSTLKAIDGTPNLKALGANAVLAVSLAFARACAKAKKTPLYKSLSVDDEKILPIPMLNILNGGAHSSNNIDIQEFMIMPLGFSHFTEGLRASCEVYHTLGKILKEKGLSTGVGDEGGFAPNIESDEEALDLVLEAIFKAGFDDDKFKLALDIAATEWVCDGGGYKMPKRGKMLDTNGMIDYVKELCKSYPIRSVEDPLGESDFAGFEKLTKEIGDKVQIVGDDLFVTNPDRLQKGISNKAANAILIKVNQIGTLSDAIKAIRLAYDNGYNTIISHRSGETADSFIADLAVGLSAGQIKTGAPCRSERCEKYNRLLEIEKELGPDARYGRMF